MNVDNGEIGDQMIERVMQYCDGTLPAAEMAQMRSEIAANPALQQIADDLTRGATLAREALSGIANAPVPLHLVRGIAQAPRAERPKPFRSAFFPREIAAALAGLLIGGAAIGLWSSQQTTDDGLRLAGIADTGTYAPAFKAALADLLGTPGTLRSLTYITDPSAGNEAEITMVAWFKLTDGSTCGEFRQNVPAAGPTSGIACQRASGAWDIMMRSAE